MSQKSRGLIGINQELMGMDFFTRDLVKKVLINSVESEISIIFLFHFIKILTSIFSCEPEILRGF